MSTQEREQTSVSMSTQKTAQIMDSQERKIVLKFYNINSDRRLASTTVIGKAFPELQPSVRKDVVCEKVIQAIGINEIVILLEVDDQMLNGLVEYVHHSTELKYRSAIYNTSQGSFKYLVLTRLEGVVETVREFPLTKSGNFFEGMRPAAPVSGETPSAEFLDYKEEILQDNFDKSVMMLTVQIQNDDQLTPLDVYCTHPGLANTAKLLQTKKIVEIIQSNSIDHGRPFVLGGDLNSFDQTASTPTLYLPQIELLSSMENVIWATNGVNCTFYAYPFDIVFKMNNQEKDKYFLLIKEEKVDEFRSFCEEMSQKYGLEGGCLDHVFHSSSLQVQTTVIDEFGALSDHYMLRAIVEY